MTIRKVHDQIYGYTFADPSVLTSPVTLRELDELKNTVGLTAQDESFLRLAGEVLADQTEQVVNLWRSEIIASNPNLSRHSRSPEGDPLPKYLAQSNLRFRQWILDTCLRPYDQDWLNYQHETALRHTSARKNAVDGVCSTAYVPFRDVTAFVAVMNDTIKQFLSTKGHDQTIVDRMHSAWCKSLQLQLALWLRAYCARSGDCWGE